MATSRKGLRWAVLGTGAIAYRFAADMAYAQSGRITVVGARTVEKAERLAMAIGTHARGLSIDAAVAADVDAVYVATPNSTHVALALAALAVGKPVLIEKPLVTTPEDGERIAEAARVAGLLAMEALWVRFTPGIVRMKALVDGGAKGAVRRGEASLSFNRPFDRCDPALAPDAGALLDLGVYPVSLALHFAGPVIETTSLVRPAPNGVPAAAVLALSHHEALSSVSCGFDGEGGNEIVVVGTTGVLRGHRSLLCPPLVSLRRTRAVSMGGLGAEGSIAARSRAKPVLAAMRQLAGRLTERRFPSLIEGSGLHYQADHFADCLAQGLTQSPIMPLDQSIAALRVLAAANQAAVPGVSRARD